MGIYDKIEDIRNKPEHVRIRYAWFCAISGTVLVMLIWMVSFSSKEKSIELNSSDIFLEQLDSQGKPLKDAASEVQGSFYEMNKKAEEAKRLEEEATVSEEAGVKESSGIDNEFLGE